MWGKKPDGWKNLSEEDRAFMKGLSQGNSLEILLRAIAQKKFSCADFILEAYELRRGSERLSALKCAMDAGATQMVTKILETKRGLFAGFDFGGFDDDKRGAREVFQKAVALGDASIWEALYRAQKTTEYGQLEKETIASILLEKPLSDAQLLSYIDVIPAKDHSVFTCLYSTVCRKYPAQKKLVLGNAKKFYASRSSSELVRYANEGDEEMVKALLDLYADPNAYNARCFFKALEGKQYAMMYLLLPLIDFHLFEEKMQWQLENIQDHNLREKALEAFHAAHPGEGESVYARIDDQTLSEVKKISAELRLTTLFNFRFAKETTIVEKTGDSPTLSTAVRDFRDISQTEVLEEMRQKLIDLKGHPDALNVGRLRKESLVELKKLNSKP